MIMMAWSDSSAFRNDEQVMWQGRIHVYQGNGRFRYIIRPDSGVVPTAILPEANPYEIASSESAQRSSERMAAMMTRLRNDFLLYQVFIGIMICIMSGFAYVCSIGVKDNIVWKQLVGGTGMLSSLVSMVGPTLRVTVPWGTRARPLHQIAAKLKTGVIIVGSTFINVLIVFLAFRIMDFRWRLRLVCLAGAPVPAVLYWHAYHRCRLLVGQVRCCCCLHLWNFCTFCWIHWSFDLNLLKH